MVPRFCKSSIVSLTESPQWEKSSSLRRPDNSSNAAGPVVAVVTADAATAKTKLMRRSRKTKIVVTLGPASSTPQQIKALFEAGADVFRINMSHTPRQMLAELHGRVRALEREEDRAIGVLVDLQGPKIRLGELMGGEAELSTEARAELD